MFFKSRRNLQQVQ